MSQFDFPRINFHGQALLDTPTANNGYYQPLTLFDQQESEAYMPPRVYMAGQTCTPPAGIPILKDKYGREYVPIQPITPDNYKEWAITPLGTFGADSEFADFYKCIKWRNESLYGKVPGYWNFFGDLSMTLQNVLVTGITFPDPNGGVNIFTPQDEEGCPALYKELLGSEVSFNTSYFEPNSRTSAYMSDVDSVGQLCTQIFIGQVGIYKRTQEGNQTYVQGKPVKSTNRWMGLTRVLNMADPSIIPMGGSGCFYSMVPLNPESSLKAAMEETTGQAVSALFMKLNIHRVYEVRMPDYSKMPVKRAADKVIPTNPARVAITGSFCPWLSTDMKTATASRVMKPAQAVSINTSVIPAPVPKGKSQPLTVPDSVELAPIQLVHNKQNSLISLDVFGSINEYGSEQGNLPDYAGEGDIAPYTSFKTYDYGQMTLAFQPDNGSVVPIRNFDYSTYNEQQFIASGGMIDLPVPGGMDYSSGSFQLYITNQGPINPVMKEADTFVTSDQEGIYGEQGQADNNYLSDGLPEQPCTLRVFYRGTPVLASPAQLTMQKIDLLSGTVSNETLYAFDGHALSLPVDVAGCLSFGFVPNGEELLKPDLSNFLDYVTKTSFVVLRVLSKDAQLKPYLNGEQEITWQAVYDNVFKEYATLLPIMDMIVPFTEANWSDPFMLAKMIQLISLDNWNKPMYMPVTRGLTKSQRQLLQLWAQQVQNSST